MRSMMLSALVLSLFLLPCSSANASSEWWHHTFDMPTRYSYDISYGLASCSHTESDGHFFVTAETVEKNVVLATVPGASQILSEGTCYAQHTLELDAQASFTRSLSVSASESNGGAVTGSVGGGFEAGKKAKGFMEVHVEYSKTWDWTVTNTYEESYTGSATVKYKWPESGERKCTGPGASVYRMAYVKGHRATVTVENRYLHRCTLTYFAPSGNEQPGDTVVIAYSDDNTVKGTGTATGVNPVMVEGGPVIEVGPIDDECTSY